MSAYKAKLAASNIGWAKEDDERVWARMRELGYQGLEIAPGRVFPQEPYGHLNGIALFAGVMKQKYGFDIPSMQSIWYGQAGNIFEPRAADRLASYTNEAFAFARACRCPSVVFGCPKNRRVPEGRSPEEAIGFFTQLAILAGQQGTHLALEANPAIYGTNFLNTTQEVFAFRRRLEMPSVTVNLDLGAMVQNGEALSDFVNQLQFVSHIHVSEPYLAPLEHRAIHRELALLLGAVNYQGFVSLEMKCADYDTVNENLTYLAEVFA